MNISVIGLGKLGSPMAAVFASKGHTVIGLDLNKMFVEAIILCRVVTCGGFSSKFFHVGGLNV